MYFHRILTEWVEKWSVSVGRNIVNSLFSFMYRKEGQMLKEETIALCKGVWIDKWNWELGMARET